MTLRWKKLSEEKPDPKDGCILYRHHKTGRGQTWFVGLAYFTVSGKWNPDINNPEKTPYWQIYEDCRHRYEIEWMAIPE